ncbi:MAG: serine/threonine protein phosphatase [Hyphomonadaceae bacterium]|nr:serine/threonine protein phosphatase [Hyphomonadaceae bacterium]
MASLFSSKSKAKRPSAGEGVVYAVGDIHGRADLLARMFELLEADMRKSRGPACVVFLGDYVDRGPDSAEVIDLLLLGRPEGARLRFLKGNHEAAMLSFLTDPAAGRAWLQHGGLETLASYQVSPLPSLGAAPSEVEAAGKALQQKLPQSHRAFLSGLERFVLIGDYLFAHAGVDPAKSLAGQDDRDLLWIRRRFLDDQRRWEHCVVHGHTPHDQPFADARRIGVDTGAYFSGVLTAARLEGEQVDFIAAR